MPVAREFVRSEERDDALRKTWRECLVDESWCEYGQDASMNRRRDERVRFGLMDAMSALSARAPHG